MVTGDSKSSSDPWDCLETNSNPPPKSEVLEGHTACFCWKWLPKNAQTPASENCLKSERITEHKVPRSSRSVPDFCCVRRSIITDYLALADDYHMEVPVSTCLPAIWVLLLVLIFLVKAVKWGDLKNTQNQQLLGRSETPAKAKYAGIWIIC